MPSALRDQTKVFGSLELKLWTVVKSPDKYWELNPGPLQEQQLFQTFEPSLQPIKILCALVFCTHVCMHVYHVLTRYPQRTEGSAWSLKTVTSCPVGAGNQTQASCENCKYSISPVPEFFSFMVNFIVKSSIFRGLFNNCSVYGGYPVFDATFYCMFSSKSNLLWIGTLKHSCRKCRLAELLPGG